jgi:hypothetical protein
MAKGYTFVSDTDTEVIPKLARYVYDTLVAANSQRDLVTIVKAVLRQLVRVHTRRERGGGGGPGPRGGPRGAWGRGAPPPRGRLCVHCVLAWARACVGAASRLYPLSLFLFLSLSVCLSVSV